jgi:hypothetical protein
VRRQDILPPLFCPIMSLYVRSWVSKEFSIPRIALPEGASVHCIVDDFLWPWDCSTPVLMMHGFARNATFSRRLTIAASRHDLRLRTITRVPSGHLFSGSGCAAIGAGSLNDGASDLGSLGASLPGAG